MCIYYLFRLPVGVQIRIKNELIGCPVMWLSHVFSSHIAMKNSFWFHKFCDLIMHPVSWCNMHISVCKNMIGHGFTLIHFYC